MNRVCPPCPPCLGRDCNQGRDCPAHSLNTRTYPRTLQAAFGPHTSTHIDEPEPAMHKADVVMCLVILPLAIVAVVAITAGWM